MDKKKKSFVFNIEWQEILLAYPGEVRLEVYDAIIEYVASGTISELKPMAKMAFSFIKKELDYSIQKYEEVVEKRKAASKIAVEKRKLSKESDCTTSNQMVPHDTKWLHLDTDNVNDNVNDIKETTTKVVAKKAAAKAATLQERESKFYESLIPYVGIYGKEMIRAFFDYWSQPNKSKTKLGFEMEKKWDLAKRLALWASRDKSTQRHQSDEIGMTLKDNSPEKYDSPNEKKWEDRWNK